MFKNISNLSENLLIILISVFAGGIIGFYASNTSNKMTLKQVQPTLEKAIEKATNEITNKIEVPKIKKSEPVQVILSPNNEQIAVRDTCNTIDLSKLNDSQLKRLQRWLND